LESAKRRLGYLIAELDMLEHQLADVESTLEEMLKQTGHSESLLSVKGIGVVTAAEFLRRGRRPA